MIEVVLDAGVLSFDGRVLEAFGFSIYDRTQRAHIAKLERIEMDPGGRHSDPSVTFTSGTVLQPISVYHAPQDAPQIQALVDAVRAAAPGLR